MTKNASLGLFGGHLYGPNFERFLGGGRNIQESILRNRIKENFPYFEPKKSPKWEK